MLGRPTGEGDTPLALAAQERDTRHGSSSFLLRMALITEGSCGRTPWAAEMGDEVVVKWLLSKDNVVTDSVDCRVRTPLSWAAQMGNEVVVKLLLSKDVTRTLKTVSYGRRCRSGTGRA